MAGERQEAHGLALLELEPRPPAVWAAGQGVRVAELPIEEGAIAPVSPSS